MSQIILDNLDWVWFQVPAAGYEAFALLLCYTAMIGSQLLISPIFKGPAVKVEFSLDCSPYFWDITQC